MDADSFIMAAFMSSIPGKKKIMNAAAVPPTRCSTSLKSVTCTWHMDITWQAPLP